MNHVVIGFGSIGKRHVRNLEGLVSPADEIFTVDPVENSKADYADLISLLLHIDAKKTIFYVCAPTSEHYSCFQKLIPLKPAGIFVEKPLFEKGYQIKLNLTKIIPIAIGFCYRYHPAIKLLKNDKSLSSLNYLHFFAGDALLSRYGATAMETMASHSIDAAQFITGPIASYSSQDNGKNCSLQLVHESGCLTQIHCDIDAPNRDSQAIFCFEGGSGSMSIGRNDDMYVEELRAFLNFVETNEPGDLCTLDQAKQTQQIIGNLSL